jgi:hypothetical protein
MTSGILDVGPALEEIRAAQREDDEAAQHPYLRRYAAALAAICRDLGNPLVWPVGSPAEQLAGAAVILSGGKVSVRGWTTDVTDKRVLLLTITAVTALPLLAAAEHARRLGAAQVYSCGVRVQGLRADELPEILDAFLPLVAQDLAQDLSE